MQEYSRCHKYTKLQLTIYIIVKDSVIVIDQLWESKLYVDFQLYKVSAP